MLKFSISPDVSNIKRVIRNSTKRQRLKQLECAPNNVAKLVAAMMFFTSLSSERPPPTAAPGTIDREASWPTTSSTTSRRSNLPPVPSSGCWSRRLSATAAKVGSRVSAGVATSAAAATAAGESHIAPTVALAKSATVASLAGVSAALAGALVEPCGDFLAGLDQQIDELSGDVVVLVVEERRGQTHVTDTTGTTDSMDVLVDVAGQVVVDDQLDVGDIETSSGHGGRHQNGASARAEERQRLLALALVSVTVDAAGAEAAVVQKVVQLIGAFLGLREDQRQAVRLAAFQNLQKRGALVVLVHPQNLLRNVLTRGTDSSDGQENVVVQEIAGEQLDLFREGSAEHERLSLVLAGHAVALDNVSDLGFETHIEHAIGLVEDQVAAGLETDFAAFDKVLETSGCGDEKMAAAIEVAHLTADVGTAVYYGGSHSGFVGELSGFVVDLRGELTSWREYQTDWIKLSPASTRLCSQFLAASWTFLEDVAQNRQQKRRCFTGTCLSASHQVATAVNNRNSVLLYRCRPGVLGTSNVVVDDGAEIGLGKFGNVTWYIVTGSLYRDIIVLVKVNTRVGACKKLALESLIAGGLFAPIVTGNAD